MNSYTLIKTKIHNEHIMAAVLTVLILYHLPLFAADKGTIPDLIILIAVGLLTDLLASLIRYKRIWCCVSGAVTASVISLLTYGIPLWGRILAVLAALIIGKHIWGGTGKNWFNPAMIGLLPLALAFQLKFPFFDPSALLFPALIAGIVFLFIRPFAGLGFIIGSVLGLLINGELSAEKILAYGILFWACLILTDPVTVTMHPIAGFAASFLAGICVLYYFPLPLFYIISVLAVNIFSKAVDQIIGTDARLAPKLRLPKIYKNDASAEQAIDLTEDKSGQKTVCDYKSQDKETILNRIRDNVVFGMGGAGYTSYRKIIAVMDADTDKKYLIINGAECDPGLVHDKWLLRHQYDDIYKGVELLKACISFNDVYLAVKRSTAVNGESIKLCRLPDSYPVGAERILIRKVLDINLGYGELPAFEGILVLNVQTVYAIAQAVLYNRPADTRYLTVANLKNRNAKVVKVRLGMKLRDIMDAVYPDAGNIYAGGGIMQAHMADDNDYVDKTVNYIATGPFPYFKESPQCSGCGMCIQSCPCGLKVNKIADLVDKSKIKETAVYNVRECIGCGSCSYCCPAGRNLAARVQHAKKAINHEA